jgi:site-specific recombinase XerD
MGNKKKFKPSQDLKLMDQVQELMGHKDEKTTEIYTHVMNKDLNAVQSPLDRL